MMTTMRWGTVGLLVVTVGCRRDRDAARNDPTRVETSAASASPSASAPGAPSPSDATPGFAQVVAGAQATCGRTQEGGVLCWGDDAFTTTKLSAAQVPPPQRMSPSRVEGIDQAVDIDVSASHGCAVTKAGKVACWVDHTAENLGVTDAKAPSGSGLFAYPLGDEKGATKVRASTAARATFCFAHDDGSSSCTHALPAMSPLFSTKLSKATSIDTIAPGDLLTCAMTKVGRVACTNGADASNATFDPLLDGASMISVGSAFACATKAARAYCWGSNGSGQTGAAGPSAVEKPTEVRAVADVDVKSVHAGVYHACAVTAAGRVRCWGDDRYGQSGRLGADIAGIEGATDVAVGEWHSCALLASTKIVCWGRNNRGQLGDASSRDSTAPRPVIVR